MTSQITQPIVKIGVLDGDVRAIELAIAYLFKTAEVRHHQRIIHGSVGDECTMTVTAGTKKKTVTKKMQLVIATNEAMLHACNYKVVSCTARRGKLPMRGYSNGRRALRADGMPVAITDEQLSTRSYFLLFDGESHTLAHAANDIIDFAMQGARRATPLRREVYVLATLTPAGPREIPLSKAIPERAKLVTIIVAA